VNAHSNWGGTLLGVSDQGQTCMDRAPSGIFISPRITKIDEAPVAPALLSMAAIPLQDGLTLSAALRQSLLKFFRICDTNRIPSTAYQGCHLATLALLSLGVAASRRSSR